MENKNGVLLTHKEAAQRLNVSGRTLANWNLNKIRIGRKIYYGSSREFVGKSA